ncbi:MAG: FAD-dependent oxidoreductase [Ruminococcaceae bacterium]|nr:FAD-dependent oxidoreductase [Oscillospiraceae bacterium]
MYDVIIVGAGPAGLTAALYALRADKKVLVLEKETFGGQITYSPKVENYPGFMQMSGNEFAEKLLDQVTEHGADIEMCEVTGVIDNGATKTVITDTDRFEGKTVILSTGCKHRHLGVEGEDELIGEGISFCAVCDGAFYAGRKVGVVGGGNSALVEAMMLSENCAEVTIIQNLAILTGEPKMIRALESKPNVKMIFNTVVTGFEKTDVLTGVKLHNTETGEDTSLPVDGLFVAIGHVPENDAFDNVAELNNYGYIVADEACTTKTPGVFVAGDCRTKNVRQITTATADGAVAALAACRYIDSL